jgi:hypothetical protein
LGEECVADWVVSRGDSRVRVRILTRGDDYDDDVRARVDCRKED